MIKPYIVAFAVGLLVGVIYGVIKVRSPAPPVIALVGLLGILAGEQLVPLSRRLLFGPPLALAAATAELGGHQMGSPSNRTETASSDEPPGGSVVPGRRHPSA